MMKKASLSFILIATVLFSSCSQSENGNIETSIPQNMPEQLTIWCDEVFADEYGQTDKDELRNWCTYMSDKYGGAISLKTKLDVDSSSYGGIDGAVSLGKIEGIACIDAASINAYCIQNETEDGNTSILPLEDFLKDNKVWKSLPEDFRNRFYLNGHLWALPKSTAQTVNVTSINTDWLKKVGMEIPTNLDELFEVGKAFLEYDVDGDGNNKNNYLFGCPYGLCADVLHAFGLYEGTGTSCTYNPVDEIYEYPFLKPNTQTALEYLQRMYKAGMIDPNSLIEPDKTDKAMMNGAYGTVQGSPGEAKYGINEAYEPLDSLAKEYPTIFTFDREGYVLTGLTKDPGIVVNAFVNIAYGSVKGTLECTLGNPDYYVVNSNHSVVLQYKDDDNKTVRACPNLVNVLDVVGGSTYTIVSQTDDIKNAIKNQRAQIDFDKSYIQDGIKKGSVIQVPIFRMIPGDYLDNPGKKMMVSLCIMDVSAQKALDDYKLAIFANAETYQRWIDNQNEQIGKTSKQDVAALLQGA